jgi:2-hydroxy-3-oxopropionate reductase
LSSAGAKGRSKVSGGEIGAIQGILSIMAGEEGKVFDDCMEILKPWAKTLFMLVRLVRGGFVKLANQIIVALNIAAVGEAFTLAVKAGLDPQVIYQAISGGMAGSSVLETKTPMTFGRNFNPGFKSLLKKSFFSS